MNIDISKLPMTLETIRQEVIKNEGDRVIDNYKDNANSIAMSLLMVPLVMLYMHSPHHMNKIVLTIQLVFVLVSLIIFCYTIMGGVQKYYHKKLAPKNYGLSEADIEKKVAEYTHDILQKMQDEMKQSEKIIVALQQKYTAMKNAYYEPSRVYSSFVCKQ